MFTFLTRLDVILWDFIGLFIILFVGIYLTIYSKFFQFKALLRLKVYIRDLVASTEKNTQGTNPIKLYFASVGGMIGLGNIVTVASVVTFGGPGSIIWLWIASFLGMMIKYAEVYLGIKYRKRNNNGFNGGPMYYLMVAFKNKYLSVIVCILLCIYGADVSQFLIITDTIVNTFSINRYLVISVLIFFIIFVSIKGTKRFATVCAVMMPPLILGYIALGVWVIFDNFFCLPSIFSLIISSFFDPQSYVGGLISGSLFLSAHYGVSRAVYSGDIGIGYDSIIQSETQIIYPEKQARMSVFALFTDSLICTISILILLFTGVWKIKGLQPSEYVISALKLYLPHVEYFMVTLFILAGFTTITGYLVVGQKCATYLNYKFGKVFYIIYSVVTFVFFSFYDQEQVILIMSVSGGLLMVINLVGVFKLRKSIKFL